MKLNSCFLIISLFTLFISCDLTHQDDELIYFPNEIGNEWEYFYFDSLASKSDTIKVQIVDEITINDGKKVNVWLYIFKDKIDTQYVEVLADTVKFYDNLKYFTVSTLYILPIELGNEWAINNAVYPDSGLAKVTDKTSIKVIAGQFAECYLINESWGAFNDYGIVHTWFVPGIGVVKKHHLGWGEGLANNYWELLRFKLKN